MRASLVPLTTTWWWLVRCVVTSLSCSNHFYPLDIYQPPGSLCNIADWKTKHILWCWCYRPVNNIWQWWPCRTNSISVYYCLNKTSCLHMVQVNRKQLSYITCMFGYAPVNMKSWGSCCPIYCQRLPTGAGVLSLPLHCPWLPASGEYRNRYYFQGKSSDK